MFNYKEAETDSVEFIPVASIEDFSEDGRIFVEVDDLAIVVMKIADNFFAIGDVCTHDDGPLGEGEIEAYEVVCPRHGARFDIRTGKANTLPAVVDIPAYPIRLVAGQIEIGIPFEG